jgi:hypothetical protein
VGDNRENNFPHYGSYIRLHHRHGNHHRPFADRVMNTMLTLFTRGFALYAGDPAVTCVFGTAASNEWSIKRAARPTKVGG